MAKNNKGEIEKGVLKIIMASVKKKKCESKKGEGKEMNGSLTLSRSLSLYLFLSHAHIFLSLCSPLLIYRFLSQSLSLFLSFSSPFLRLSFCLSHLLLSLTLSIYLTHSLSVYFSLTLCLSSSFTHSLFLSLPLSPPSHARPLSLSLSLPFSCQYLIALRCYYPKYFSKNKIPGSHLTKKQNEMNQVTTGQNID